MQPRIVISSGCHGSLTHVFQCARILSPLDRISVVVPPHMASHARGQIAWYDGVRLSVQVRNQRSADVLIPLTHAFARDPLSTIVFLPAEFSIADPYVLAETILAAIDESTTISLIGVAPFRWKAGAQWSPFVAVGRVTSFWDLLRQKAPLHAALLENYLEAIGSRDAVALLTNAFEHMRPLDLVGDLLSKLRDVDLSTVPPLPRYQERATPHRGLTLTQ